MYRSSFSFWGVQKLNYAEPFKNRRFLFRLTFYSFSKHRPVRVECTGRISRPTYGPRPRTIYLEAVWSTRRGFAGP